MAGRIVRTAMAQLAQRGFVVRRHPGARRQVLLERHRVDVVVDVGAARGAYGRELRGFGYRGGIASFEPLPDAYRDLLVESAGDDRWAAHNCALGAAPGAATINIASNSDSSSLLPLADAHRAAAPQVDYVGTVEVEVARLDDVAGTVLGAAERLFLKLDTQGFERQVLEGAAETLPRCVGLQLELSFVPLYDGGMLVDEAVAMAYDAGFRMVAIDPGFASPDGRVLQADGVFFREADLTR